MFHIVYTAPSDLSRGQVIVRTDWTPSDEHESYWTVLLVDRCPVVPGRVRVYVQARDGSERRRTLRYDAGERVIRALGDGPQD